MVTRAQRRRRLLAEVARQKFCPRTGHLLDASTAKCVVFKRRGHETVAGPFAPEAAGETDLIIELALAANEAAAEKGLEAIYTDIFVLSGTGLFAHADTSQAIH